MDDALVGFAEIRQGERDNPSVRHFQSHVAYGLLGVSQRRESSYTKCEALAVVRGLPPTAETSHRWSPQIRGVES